MAFLALAVPAFVGGLVTGFLRPTLPFRKGKKRGEGFVLWPELAEVLAYQSEIFLKQAMIHVDLHQAAFMCRASIKCYAWTCAQCCSWTTRTTPAGWSSCLRGMTSRYMPGHSCHRPQCPVPSHPIPVRTHKLSTALQHHSKVTMRRRWWT